ncbi:MAG: hypothetical protein GYA59_14695 [Chloroflexi bacterium]|nr:hypothetical protein [Chloroflexota bacterium]
MNSPSLSNKSAWVQLYEARRVTVEVESRSPGRPPAPIPRRKIGLTLSQGEINELEVWKERFSVLLERKVSTGETVGILTRICTARLGRLSGKTSPKNLTELVERMIG